MTKSIEAVTIAHIESSTQYVPTDTLVSDTLSAFYESYEHNKTVWSMCDHGAFFHRCKLHMLIDDEHGSMHKWLFG